jgi:hypothetical protein
MGGVPASRGAGLLALVAHLPTPRLSGLLVISGGPLRGESDLARARPPFSLRVDPEAPTTRHHGVMERAR